MEKTIRRAPEFKTEKTAYKMVDFFWVKGLQNWCTLNFRIEEIISQYSLLVNEILCHVKDLCLSLGLNVAVGDDNSTPSESG